jgi:hypothetical protein
VCVQLKAGVFSRRWTYQGKSQDPVAWIAFAAETKRMKPIDEAIFRMVSESSGRNASERIGGLENRKLQRPSPHRKGEGNIDRRN